MSTTRNPFRSRASTPNSTGTSTPPAPTPPPSSPSPIDDLLFGLPPDSLLPESAPPAYSPTPNVRGGESVVEQGPRRPFQRAPEPLIQLPVPSRQERSPAPTPSPPQRPRYQPPRVPPPSQLPIPTPERPLSQMSDFARDFYSAGTTPSPSETPAREEQEREPRPRQPRYAPPPGAPPPRRPRAASTSSGAGSTAPSVSDGRPTTTPTPGHPLLRNGQTLVYPEGYTCPKCQNTGYKNFDPSHPCRKCWDRFGKPLTSVIASSPWGEQGGAAAASQSSRGRSFQRPLPTFNPPQRRIEPSMPGAYPNSPCSSSQPRTNAPVMAMPAGPVPPPGSTVVNPGDPRIGGRLCWRCGGRGVTPFLIFEEMTCETCGGIGRLLN
ncbi:hypothetical protein BJV78DRAFT_1348017 [Lactifluus subvellereus]|nr:hypothetical protein BJV78DRAFT_1348017 [Lactifluus subvellereus]